MFSAFNFNRRLSVVVGIAAITGCLGIPVFATAQTYPNKPITLISPTSAGGPVDIASRLVATEMSTILGQRVVVENRPGASQKIGIHSLLRAPRDGYTFSAASGASMTINPLIDSAIGYDPLKDFTLLSKAVEIPTILVVHPSVPVRTLRKFVAFAKANPGELAYGSGGTGTSLHFSTAALFSMLGINVLHVPYKSSGPAFLGLITGQISILMPDIGRAKLYVNSGKLIGLATSGSKRAEEFPNVPIFSETGISGLKGYDGYTQWVGFIAAAGIPQEAATKLLGALHEALRVPKVKEAFVGTLGFAVVSQTPQQFTEQLRLELEYTKKVLDSGAVKLR